MKNKKKSDLAILLDYAGSRKGADLSGAGTVGCIHAAEYGAVHLHLAGRPRSDRRRTGLDAGAERYPLGLAGVCLCGGRHRPVFCGADVYPPGGVSAPRPTSASGAWPI